jgi:hypothetical protein
MIEVMGAELVDVLVEVGTSDRLVGTPMVTMEAHQVLEGIPLLETLQ